MGAREIRGLLEGARHRLDLSLDEMGQRTGIDRTVLWRIERGAYANLPKPQQARAICKAYGVQMVDLVAAYDYNVGVGDVEEAIRRRVIADTSLMEYIQARYEIDEATAAQMARVYELGLTTQSAYERERRRPQSGALPIADDSNGDESSLVAPHRQAG